MKINCVCVCVCMKLCNRINLSLIPRSISGCNSSTIGPYPSIFATLQGNCTDEESEDNSERVMEAEIESVNKIVFR